ncbi:MAG: TIGR03936 family radical SAM-associated protein [Filifactoraceae bacterium]
MVIRCQFTKVGDIAYISHLDILNVIHRGINRSGIRIKYSEGFNPHPKLAFSPALSLGVDSISEYVDVELDEVIKPKEFIERVNCNLPEGVRFTKAKVYNDKKSLSAQITHNIYKLTFYNNQLHLDILERAITNINNASEIIVKKVNKKGQLKEYNQKEKIYDLSYNKGSKVNILVAVLQNSPEGALKIKEFMDIVNEEVKKIEIKSEYSVSFSADEIIKMSSISIVDGEVTEVM